MLNKLASLIIVTVLLTVAACTDRHSGYSSFTTLPENGWAFGDTLQFSPTNLDSIDLRDIYVAIRHSNDYIYRNLWLEITVADSLTTYRDTLCMMLADDYGRWHGKGIGPSKQFQSQLPRLTPVSDSTLIIVRHIMRTDTLAGIEQVGITIETPRQ